jgi:hypothetical protein
MVKFIIVERTICDAISSTQAGPAPFTPPRKRREAMPWGKVSEGGADGDAVAANVFPRWENFGRGRRQVCP